MMGNYSLLDSLQGVGLTPLGEDMMRDPRAASRMATDLSGMSAYKAQEPGVLLGAEPGGVVTGQPGSTFYSATPEDDTNVVMKAIGTVLGAPFNILRGAKEGLEEAIGHPYAMQRQAQDEQYAMLASTLSDTDKTAVGMPVDRSGVNARQTSGSTVATGMSYGISPTLTPRKTGIVEMITGETRKQRALEMARLQAALKAQGVNLNIEALKAGIYKDVGAGTNSFAGARKTNIEADQIEQYGPQKWQGEIAKLGAETFHQNQAGHAQGALAGKYGAEAGLANAKTDHERAITGPDAYRIMQLGNRAAAGADKDWAMAAQTTALTEPKKFGLLAAGTARAAQAQASLNKGVATGTNSPQALRASTDAASKLEAALSKVRPLWFNRGSVPSAEEQRVYAAFGVPKKRNELGVETGEYDIEGWRNSLVGDTPEGSGDAMGRLQELIDSLSNFKLSSSPDVQAQPDNATLGNESATQSSTAPGQVPMTSGETESVFREYGRNPKAIDAAYRAGLIPEAAARKALEVLGYQRMR